VIRFEDVGFSYQRGGEQVPVLSGISLDVDPGQSLAVLGSNGSGKSTLVKLANGLLAPASGAVTVDGIDTRDTDRTHELRQRVAVVFQRPDNQIVATTVEDDVAFGPENLGLPRDEIRRRVDEALARVGLSGLERREPHLLSGGQKQRLAIAGALAMQPAYLVLDEPTSMLDPEGRAAVLAIADELRRGGHGILHVTHDIADASHADRVIVLCGGGVAFEGAPAELVERLDLPSEWGLELPPLALLGGELERVGVPGVSGASDSLAILESLWR
jgi:energy-coupling factor transport system ATP-binding protein